MITYDLTLEKQRLLGADRFSVAANANETLYLRFNFDRHWRRFDSKAAVFRNSDNQFYIIEIIANRAKIPWEVLTKTGEFDLSVIGFDSTKIITSDKAEVRVKESLLPDEYKTFSPSEVIFDRFRRECIQQAYLDYEDEIKSLKAAHTAEKLLLGEEIEKAKEDTQKAIEEKDAEINRLIDKYALVMNELNLRLQESDNIIAELQPKADSWDMVDYALSMARSAAQSLILCGTSEYSLPMLNTASISSFSPTSFTTNLKEVGLDLTSVTDFSKVFSSKNGIERITLRNTHNVTTMANLFDTCSTIREINIGSLQSCTILNRFANSASLLEKVSFTDMVSIQDLYRCFSNCVVLKEIDGIFDLRTATNISEMFTGCYSLETVRFVRSSIRKSFALSACINFSRESIISVIDGLAEDVTGTLYLSKKAFEDNFPTPEEQEEVFDFITYEKGWTLSLS